MKFPMFCRLKLTVTDIFIKRFGTCLWGDSGSSQQPMKDVNKIKKLFWLRLKHILFIGDSLLENNW